jgi:hypothetical protein
MLLFRAIGIAANGDKHPLGLVEGTTERKDCAVASTSSSSDPTRRRLFNFDGGTLLSKAVRRSFGRKGLSSVASFTRGGTFSAALSNMSVMCFYLILEGINESCNPGSTCLANRPLAHLHKSTILWPPCVVCRNAKTWRCRRRARETVKGSANRV